MIVCVGGHAGASRLRTPRKAPSKERRSPKQNRSIETVKAIFEATASILQRDGIGGLTTARVAEVSGYGVSTIYDYFATKDAILIALARKELEKTSRSVRTALAEGDPREPTVRKVIRAMVSGFGGRQRLRGILLESMIAQGHSAELAHPIELLAELLLQQQRTAPGADQTGLRSEQVYVLTRAIAGIIRAWAMETATHVRAQTLEHELTALVTSYVAYCHSKNR